MILAPGTVRYGFPRFAADDVLPVPVTVPNGSVPEFPFFKYLLLSVTAGVISHFVIRRLSSGSSK